MPKNQQRLLANQQKLVAYSMINKEIDRDLLDQVWHARFPPIIYGFDRDEQNPRLHRGLIDRFALLVQETPASVLEKGLNLPVKLQSSYFTALEARAEMVAEDLGLLGMQNNISDAHTKIFDAAKEKHASQPQSLAYALTYRNLSENKAKIKGKLNHLSDAERRVFRLKAKANPLRMSIHDPEAFSDHLIYALHGSLLGNSLRRLFSNFPKVHIPLTLPAFLTEIPGLKFFTINSKNGRVSQKNQGRRNRADSNLQILKKGSKDFGAGFKIGGLSKLFGKFRKETIDEPTPKIRKSETRRPEFYSENAEQMTGYRVALSPEFDLTGHARDIFNYTVNPRKAIALKAEMGVEYRKAVAVSTKLARQIQTQSGTQIERPLEEGIIDPASLSSVIVDPTNPFVHFERRPAANFDVAVTLLIDNSASMVNADSSDINVRNRYKYAFLATDALVQSFEKIGIKTEVLGFTTSASKTEEAFKYHDFNGKNHTLGRAIALKQTIFKEHDEQLRQSRLSNMLNTHYYNGTVIGEPMLWAHERLLARPEQRKILIVISDGEPVGIYNGRFVNFMHTKNFKDHFMQVSRLIDYFSPVQLAAIGVGTEIGDYIDNNVVIRSPKDISKAITELLTGIIMNKPMQKRPEGLRFD